MIVIIGEGGSGKTTILNELVKRGYKKAVNYTTRAIREDEEENPEYIFVSKDEFNNLWDEGKLLQRAEFNGEYYGISVDSLKDDVVCIQIVDSIKDVKKRSHELGFDAKRIKCFYITVPEEERTRRMLERGDSDEYIKRRIEIDNEKFKNAKEVVDYVIENNILEDAVNEIIRIDKEK